MQVGGRIWDMRGPRVRSGPVLIGLALAAAIVMRSAQAQTYTVLHNFTGGTDGAYPHAGVVRDSAGNLYGTTTNGGGASGYGTVFSLTPPASSAGSWTETALYRFEGDSHGANPYAGVVIGSGGVLYGTTPNGGGGTGFGSVFSLTPPASPGGSWTDTVLCEFSRIQDGISPYGAVTLGGDGTLYGTTTAGGTWNLGTVFSLSPPESERGAWTHSVRYNFTYHGDGAAPYAGVAIRGGGALYGTTYLGGASGDGTVFLLRRPASPYGAWSEAVLYSFVPKSPGNYSTVSGVVIGNGGVLYGTTIDGGSSDLGTVFSLTPPASPGGSWTEAVLHNFSGCAIGGDGEHPYGGIAIGHGGVLYGTTYGGGTGCDGTVFALEPPASPGGHWTERVLHVFTGSDGSNPYAGVAIGNGGMLYGTTSAGGTSRYGTVFSLAP